MGLTAKPSKNIDLTKINDIQDEVFGKETGSGTERKTGTRQPLTPHENSTHPQQDNRDMSANSTKKTNKSEKIAKNQKPRAEKMNLTRELSETAPKPTDFNRNKQTSDGEMLKLKKEIQDNGTIADLLAMSRFRGVRYTSRPYTVPRSLTIDLSRLKSKFRSRDLQYTQNELIDKMLKESLELVTADNYYELREKAFNFVKSPEQSSRRSVTLTEETVSGMAELKADLALTHPRRFSSDEIFTTLLAIAFAPLYENHLL